MQAQTTWLSQPQIYSQSNSIFQLCGRIDIRLKNMTKTAILEVGLSRSCKSTLFNIINEIPHIGVQSDGFGNQDNQVVISSSGIDVVYQPKIYHPDAAEANNGVVSVTLLPNIRLRDDYSLVDMPGYLDERSYDAAIGVSYAIKSAFKVIEECQFVLVIKEDCFKNAKELYKSLTGFCSMFNIELLSDDLKRKILQSVTFVISKALKNTTADDYCIKMRSLLQQGKNPKYNKFQTVKKISFIMEYFCEHPQQIYLFTAAQKGVDSLECTIQQDHFYKRRYFQMKLENEIIYNQKRKNIYRLPFAEDLKEIEKRDQEMMKAYNEQVNNQPDNDLKKLIPKPIQEKKQLENQIFGRLKSYTEFTKIINSFLIKAVNPTNLLNSQLNFGQQFEGMLKFAQKYNVYSKHFDLKQQTSFKTKFTVGDKINKLKIGINLPLKVFQLYEAIDKVPYYDSEDPLILQSFMKKFKDYLISLITLFRDTFCTKYEEEQCILQFLFIAVRGCNEFTILYQIMPQGKHYACRSLIDSFSSLLACKKMIQIQKQFIEQLSENIKQLSELNKQNNDQISQYLRFLKSFEDTNEGKILTQQDSYKKLKRKFLQMKASISLNPQESLIVIYENFLELTKTINEVMYPKIKQQNRQRQPQRQRQRQKKKKKQQRELDSVTLTKQTYLQNKKNQKSMSFKLLHQLFKMGSIILNLSRPKELSEDCFAFDRFDQIENCRNKCSIQQFLVVEQATTAMEIFLYTKNTESVLDAYEVILKILPYTDWQGKLQYLKEMADYCLINGRIEQAIVAYQKAMKICLEADLEDQYQEIENILTQLPNQQDKMLSYFNEKMSVYLKEFKQNKIIDPESDATLNDIIKNIKNLFIEPFQRRQKIKQTL